MARFIASVFIGVLTTASPPSDRIAVLQKAVRELMADPAFLAEARTAQIDMSYISAADVSQSLEKIFNQPPEALEAMHTYLKVGE